MIWCRGRFWTFSCNSTIAECGRYFANFWLTLIFLVFFFYKFCSQDYTNLCYLYYFLKTMISYRKLKYYLFLQKLKNYFRTIRAPIIYFIEGRSLSRPYRQINNRGFAFLFIALLIWLMYQCPNGEIPSSNCIIKAPAKWKNFVYVMTEFCHQRIKWLCP